jgi:hypothetical protein
MSITVLISEISIHIIKEEVSNGKMGHQRTGRLHNGDEI